MNPLKNSPPSSASIANCTAWLSVRAALASNMPSDSDASSRPTHTTASHPTEPFNDTSNPYTAAATSAAPTTHPTSR